VSAKEKLPANKEGLKKIGLIVLALLLLIHSIQLFYFSSVIGRVDGLNQKVVDQVEGMRENTITFAQDLNEIRQFLLLPTKDYSGLLKDENDAGETEDAQDDASVKPQSLVYTFLTHTLEAEQAKQNATLAGARIQELSKNADFQQKLAEIGLSIGSIENTDDTATLKITDDQKVPLFALLTEKKTNLSKIQSILGFSPLKADKNDALITEATAYMKAKKEEVQKMKTLLVDRKNELVAFSSHAELGPLLKNKKLTLKTEVQENEQGFSYAFSSPFENNLFPITILRKDGNFMFKDKTYEKVAEILPVLTEEVKKFEPVSAEERLLKERKNELEALFKEEAFQELLKTNKLTISNTPREEYNKLLYDLKKADGGTVLSFVIEKSSGLYKVLKDGKEIDLAQTGEDEGSKKNS
jgi:hypothetical protein